MQSSRLNLHKELVNILGDRHVYFQPPASISITYPCIVYSLSNIDDKKASNKSYLRHYCYKVTYISKDCDDDVVDKLMNFPMCSFANSFSTQGLNHYVFTIYYKNEEKET